MLPVAKNQTILVVDDEPSVCGFVASLLRHNGYIVHSALDGFEATEVFREKMTSIGLLVTDLTMPRKNGLQLIQELKTVKPELRVLIMSGNLSNWQAEIGSLPRIAKPFANDALLREVATQLS